MNVKTVIAGIAIFAAGGAAGVFATKRYFEEKANMRADEEIEEMKEFYRKNLGKEALVGEINNIINEGEKEKDEMAPIKIAYEKIAGNYNRNEELKANMDISALKYKDPEEDEEDEDQGTEFPDEYSPVRTRYPGNQEEPKVISIEEYQDGNPHFDKCTLVYYELDNTLADEAEDIIPDVNSVIGDGLLSFGELSEDADTVYIRNEALGIDYEVLRMEKSYLESVLGELPPAPQKKRRAVRSGDDA